MATATNTAGRFYPQPACATLPLDEPEMISGSPCDYCKHWMLNPCTNKDDAADCPNNDTEADYQNGMSASAASIGSRNSASQMAQASRACHPAQALL
jgi:hypothetical protein